MNNFANKRILLLVLLFLPLFACGYHSPYYIAENSSGPARTIYLEIWKNQTNETGLDTSILRSLNRWLKQSKAIKVTWDRDKAELILSGEIVSISLPGQSFNQYDRAREVNAILSVNYRLSEVQSKKLLIDEQGLTLEESYLLASESAKTRTNRKEALASINDELAEKIYLRILTLLSTTPAASNH